VFAARADVVFPEPAVFAAPADVVFPAPAPPAALEVAVRRFLTRLADELEAAGCVLVGHIKGKLHAAGQDSLAFGVTSLGGHARVAAALSDEVGAALLTINVIVFGVPESALSGLVTRAWESRVPAATTWLR